MDRQGLSGPESQEKAGEGPPRPRRQCVTCGRWSIDRYCSTSCHKLDEPGAYEPWERDYEDEYVD